MEQLSPTPVAREARIDSLDMIRGIAVMGILLMNVQSFSMPDAAYPNPMSFGDMAGTNALIWVMNHVFINQKFSALFALLFGAGIYLFMSPAANGVPKPLSLHFRRMFWLLLFGIAHFHLLWWGDILMFYAVGGAVAILFRHMPLQWLLVAALGFLLLGNIEEVDLYGWMLDPQGMTTDFAAAWAPSGNELNDESELFLSNWWSQVVERHVELRGYVSEGWLTPVFLMAIVARSTGLMLIGMFLFRTRFLQAQRSRLDYRRLALAGLIPGLLLTLINLVFNFREGFSADYNFFWGRMLDYWGGILTALGYVGLLCLAAQSRRCLAFKARLQAAGKLAFTNYLSQSLICTAVFYGYGLGLFGQVDRTGQFAIASVIIALQLWWSPLVLRKCYFGPLEWLWRCLTYWHLQPLWRTTPSARVT